MSPTRREFLATLVAVPAAAALPATAPAPEPRPNPYEFVASGHALYDYERAERVARTELRRVVDMTCLGDANQRWGRP